MTASRFALSLALLFLMTAVAAGGPWPASPAYAAEAPVIRVTPQDNLPEIVARATPGATILLADGLYRVSRPLLVRTEGLTLRGASGNRERVILDGQQAEPLTRETCTNEILAVRASKVTIADLSVRHARDHAIHISTDGLNADIRGVRMTNLHVSDSGQQLIKVNPAGTPGRMLWVDEGVLENSLVEFIDNSIMQKAGASFYTGGLDVHAGRGWLVRGNLFRNIQNSGLLMEHAVHFWSKSRDTIVEGNRFVNCYRAIGFGMNTEGNARSRTYDDYPELSGYVDHIGGVIRNNMIYNGSGIHLESGIELMNIVDAQVLHNTVVSFDAPFSSIEYRWPRTRVTLRNNLVSHSIMERDGARAELAGNVEKAPREFFVNATDGNLHLAPGAALAIDRGVTAGADLVPADFDGDARLGPPDVGADEWMRPAGVEKPGR